MFFCRIVDVRLPRVFCFVAFFILFCFAVQKRAYSLYTVLPFTSQAHFFFQILPRLTRAWKSVTYLLVFFFLTHIFVTLDLLMPFHDCYRATEISVKKTEKNAMWFLAIQQIIYNRQANACGSIWPQFVSFQREIICNSMSLVHINFAVHLFAAVNFKRTHTHTLCITLWNCMGI